MAPRPGAAQRIIKAQRQISEAMAAGRIGPDGARRWARRAARGEDIGLIEQLGSVPSLAEQNKPLMAHSNQHVLDILTKALSGGDGEHDELDGGPDHVYDPDGNDISAGITDDEADTLFPARTADEADRRQATRRSMAEARAAALAPWDEEDLHRILFGDTTGPADL